MGQYSRTRVVFYPLVAALSLLLLWFTAPQDAQPQPKPATPSAPPVTVTVIAVSPKTVPIHTEYTGTTESLDTVDIRARVDGYIEQRRFEAGQTVKAGDLLYVLDQRTYRAELQKAKAGVDKAQADVRFAQEGVEVLRAESRLAQSKATLVRFDLDVARYTPLVKKDAAPQRELDNALASQQAFREEVKARDAELKQTKLAQRTQIALAAAELDAARAKQRLAELDLEFTEIKAPVAGRIGESDLFVGGLATKNAPKPLTQLSPLDPIQVAVRIGERDYLSYAQKARANASQQGPPTFDLQLLLADGSVYPRAGRIRAVDRAVDPQTGTLGITLDFPNPEAVLLPGTSSKVRVKTAEKSNVLLVPQRAIIELQGVRSLYVVDQEDKVVVHTVTATDRIGSLWIIERGLQAGERVIVEGIQKVQPGMKVQVKIEPEPKLEQAAASLPTSPKPR